MKHSLGRLIIEKILEIVKEENKTSLLEVSAGTVNFLWVSMEEKIQKVYGKRIFILHIDFFF